MITRDEVVMRSRVVSPQLQFAPIMLHQNSDGWSFYLIGIIWLHCSHIMCHIRWEILPPVNPAGFKLTGLQCRQIFPSTAKHFFPAQVHVFIGELLIYGLYELYKSRSMVLQQSVKHRVTMTVRYMYNNVTQCQQRTGLDVGLCYEYLQDCMYTSDM